MTDIQIAQLVDRFMRAIEVGLREDGSQCEAEKVGSHASIILMLLADIQPAPVQEIVRLMSRDKSQISRTLRALEERELITRCSSPDDARICLLGLSDKGQQHVESMHAAMSRVVDQTLVNLDANERTQLFNLLNKAIGDRCGT